MKKKQISFEKFWIDVQHLCNKRKTFYTVAYKQINKVLEVRQEDIRVWTKNSGKNGSKIPKKMFLDTFTLLKPNRKILESKLKDTVQRSAFIAAVAAHLPYFRVCTNLVTIEVEQGYELH